MSISQSEARSLLRLPLDGQVEPKAIEDSFHKLVRRYPMEQFPEKFALLRDAFEILSDPSQSIRELLLDPTFDLSSFIESYEPLNAKPQGAEETFIFDSLAALLREHIEDILLVDEDDFDPEDMFGQDSEELMRSMDEIIESMMQKGTKKKS